MVFTHIEKVFESVAFDHPSLPIIFGKSLLDRKENSPGEKPMEISSFKARHLYQFSLEHEKS